jgi:poly-gamma-glutamate synthase PgsB/CapB
MREFIVAGALLAVVLAGLAFERRRLDRARARIPVRVGVTGTRGKSSVVRLIAAALREAGLETLAKTTGSRPVLILPDGTEREVERPGPASILEQKRLVRLGAELGAEALVAELMAVRPENLAAESRGILKPGLLVVTNVRLDHLEDQGPTAEAVARSLAASFGPGMTVLIPEDEILSAFREAARASGASLVAVPAAAAESLGAAGVPGALEFEVNLRLAAAVATRLNVEAGAASRGMAKARPDFGSLMIWRTASVDPGRDRLLVSAFAANDPDSTRRVLDGLAARGLFDDRGRIGLLNLREDRGDRTLQWLSAVGSGLLDDFDGLVLVGPPARAAHGRLTRRRGSRARPGLSFSARRDPAGLMAALPAAPGGRGDIVIGLGNMGGLGEALVEHWRTIGEPHVA